MRFRSQGSYSPGVAVYIESDFWNGITSISSTTNNTIADNVGETNSTWDEVTPNFRKRQRLGEIIINDFTNVRESRFDSTNGIMSRANSPNPDGKTYRQQRDGPQLTYMMEQAGYGLRTKYVIPQDKFLDAIHIAGTSARAQVSQQEADVLTMLLELKKTISTLLNPLNNLNTLISRFQRAKSLANSTLSLSKYIGSEWLKFRYGIMPIMYDIQGIIKAIEKDKSKGRHHARGSKTLSESKLDPPAIWSHGDIDTTYLDTYTDEVIIKCGLVYDAKLHVSDYLGLNLRAIPSTAWELIPFSFIVDWFVNVQEYIRALSASGIAPESGGYTVVTRTLTASRAAVNSVIARNIGAATLIRSMSGTRTIVRRTKWRWRGCGGARLKSKINLSNIDFMDRRVLDTFALIVGRLRG
jgi:hypothetical protein